MRFAIIVSKFNPEVTQGLKKGALHFFEEKKINLNLIDCYEAPGAFETALIAQACLKTRRYNGVVCLGAVIKGETAHFEFISLGATYGIMKTMLEFATPVSFGILTTYTDEQAQARSQEDAHNKGREAALACFETALTVQKING